MKTFKKHIFLFLGLFIVFTMIFLALFAPYIAPYNPEAQSLKEMLQAPSAAHWFGTDEYGRDVFSRMLYGARISLFVGFVAVGISSLIGLLLGLISGYFGGFIDTCVMRFVDIMLCFPSFFLILAVIAFVDPNISTIMIVIGLTSWMSIARLIRAETLTIKERDFVAAAKLGGASHFTLLFIHIFPNVISPLFVSMTLGIAGAILLESSLSFLGLGIQPPFASWGNILMEGKNVIEIAPWLSIYPGIAIALTVFGYNLLGESLRDWLDPRQKNIS